MGEQHTSEMLKELQAYPLDMKIWLTKQRIREWVREFGEDGVYVSFSGGKDSTVLLDIVRQEYPDVPAVFVDTGLEYPEIRDFVKSYENVIYRKPKMTFKQVIEKYGYPLFSKEVSLYLYQLKAEQTEKNKATRNLRLYGIKSDGSKVKVGKLPKKYLPMINSPFKISNKCCDVMKKSPLHKYSHESNRYPITAEMAFESRIRKIKWLQNGCNMFDINEPKSTPMAFWTEQDVLKYIKQKNLKICSVYGNVVEDTDGCENQMSLYDLGIGEDIRAYKTTGCDRTGCIFCGFGCHMEKPGEGRFERLKITHPKIYEYIMRPWEEGGLDYKNVIDWINENNGKGTIIRY